jgi:16S rRNA C1402 N4-methylase RsmH
MIRATELAQQLLRPCLKPGGWAVDATAGNGHDTLFLAQQVGPGGRVFAFDVQAAAVVATQQMTAEHPHVSVIHAGHERMAQHLPTEAKGRLAAVMFNLGYLPGADKSMITQTETTLSALAQALDYLQPSGMLTIILYPGHSGGAEEAQAVRAHFDSLPASFTVSQFRRLHTRQPAPELLIVERQ